MQIYLIRHGESYNPKPEFISKEKNIMDPPLTSNGIKQAYKMVEKLKYIEFDIIYTSDLIRAVETTHILNKSKRSKIIITKNFREINMGEIFLKSWNEFPEIYSKWLLHEEDIPYPNGENGYNVWTRCKKELDEIIKRNYKRIAIVCHGGTIRSIICGALNIPQQNRFYLGIPLQNCSISILVYELEKYYLDLFNDYSHLNKLPI